MFNKERLDGLTEMHFSGVTQQEREMAFDYLLRCIEKGGSAETVNRIFTADFERALVRVVQLMDSGVLNEEAHLAAASNIFQITGDKKLLPIFIRFYVDQGDRRKEEILKYLSKLAQ